MPAPEHPALSGSPPIGLAHALTVAVLASAMMGSAIAVGAEVGAHAAGASAAILAGTATATITTILLGWRSRWVFFAFDPLVCWIGRLRGKLFFVRAVWVAKEEKPHGWAIHQASSPFIRAANCRRFTAFAELQAVAEVLREGEFCRVQTIVVPCGSVQPSHLRRLGFAIVERRSSWLHRIAVRLAADEYRHRARLTQTRRAATYNRFAGVMPRVEFVRRFAGSGPSETAR